MGPKIKEFIKNILGPKKPVEQLIKESKEDLCDDCGCYHERPEQCWEGIGRPFRPFNVIKGGKDD